MEKATFVNEKTGSRFECMLYRDKSTGEAFPYKVPQMKTIPEIVSLTGLTKYAVRDILKDYNIPCFSSGRVKYINFDLFVEVLQGRLSPTGIA